MPDSNNEKRSGQKEVADGQPSGREADATSKETLEDIEDNEKSSSGKQDGGQQSGVPSPDGAFDDSGESKDAGPV